MDWVFFAALIAFSLVVRVVVQRMYEQADDATRRLWSWRLGVGVGTGLAVLLLGGTSQWIGVFLSLGLFPSWFELRLRHHLPTA